MAGYSQLAAGVLVGVAVFSSRLVGVGSIVRAATTAKVILQDETGTYVFS